MPSRARLMSRALLCLLLTLGTASAKADTLLGTAVTGDLIFLDGLPNNSNVNYFDPINFLVPTSGYGNSINPVNVPIVNPGIEFALTDSSVTQAVALTADFTGPQLTVTSLCLDLTCQKDVPFIMTFTDSAFTSIHKVSDTFASGGLSYSLPGDVIELDWDGFPPSFPINTSEQAVFNLASGPVGASEPSSIRLLGLAVLGIAFYACRR
jgi:hypothetical protein